MGLFDKLRKNDLETGLQQYRETPGALLIDVRNRDEYAEGHVPGSVNLSLKQLREIDEIATSYDQPLFLYCLSGARSSQAAAMLKDQGYTNARSIGGVQGYQGQLVK
ncbi:MAG: rhodanese-like domain-containing protein [Oscillospiraceae bacterium]|nr:rhodanese-like domain-containing protein [Oscillospiraceae bacterium]